MNLPNDLFSQPTDHDSKKIICDLEDMKLIEEYYGEEEG